METQEVYLQSPTSSATSRYFLPPAVVWATVHPWIDYILLGPWNFHFFSNNFFLNSEFRKKPSPKVPFGGKICCWMGKAKHWSSATLVLPSAWCLVNSRVCPATNRGSSLPDVETDRGNGLTWSHGTIEHQNWSLVFLGSAKNGRVENGGKFFQEVAGSAASRHKGSQFKVSCFMVSRHLWGHMLHHWSRFVVCWMCRVPWALVSKHW